MEQRIAWGDLPGQVRDAIQARTGRITDVRTPSAGQNSPLAAFITAENGTVFVKGMPLAARRVITQAREAAIAPLVRHISPALLWHLDDIAGWNVLGYEYIEGRHADYRPGSPDLDALVTLMAMLNEVAVPDQSGLFKRAEDRWREYVDEPEQADLFAGSKLTHSDWTPDNVLMSPSGRAWLIDWAWPTLAAAWTDPACWVLRLMASGGHTASEAEQLAARVPAFASADPSHIDLFAAANVRLWDEIVQQGPATWTKQMAEAARDWYGYRRASRSHASSAAKSLSVRPRDASTWWSSAGPGWWADTQSRSASVISSSTQANGRPAAQLTRVLVFQQSPSHRSSRSWASVGSGQMTTGRRGSPIRGAISVFASSCQVVAHTRVHGSAARRGPVSGRSLPRCGTATVR